MTTVVLPSFVQSLVGAQQAPFVLGLMSGIATAVSTIAKLFFGWLTDRTSKHKWFLIIGYTLTPVFSSCIGTAQFAWQLITYRSCAWLGKGIREPARDVWLSKSVDERDYGKAFGLQRAFDTLGEL